MGMGAVFFVTDEKMANQNACYSAGTKANGTKREPAQGEKMSGVRTKPKQKELFRMKKKNAGSLTIAALALAGSMLLGACSAAPYSAAPDAVSVAGEYAPVAAGSAEPVYYGEGYLPIAEGGEKFTEDETLATFSLKVDTAAYTNVKRYIESGSLPPADAVRTEEMINYFSYDAAPIYKEGPFSFYTEVGPSPFDANKQIAFVRVMTDEVDKSELPASNLVFLIDTSGSMEAYDKLPLLKEAFGLLVETLDGDDRVSIVTYAGSSEVVISGVPGNDKSTILNAINRLTAGGSTAGADGINTAYALAEEYYLRGGNNRVILATDGDFNVGISSVSELEGFISEKRDSGMYLSVLGFGTGNLQDSTMETLAKNGNGNYSYIDSVDTAKKVLVDELGSNLFTVADDVKAQVEFNPANVKSYRLIGYENRMMDSQDFEDDQKDAGEIGAGTDVVVMFEIELQNSGGGGTLKYGPEAAAPQPASGKYGDELFEVRIRYKDPGASDSKEIDLPVTFERFLDKPSSDFGFACSVAGFGALLRGSEYAGDMTVSDMLVLAEDNLGRDEGGYRREHLRLLEEYERMAG